MSSIIRAVKHAWIALLLVPSSDSCASGASERLARARQRDRISLLQGRHRKCQQSSVARHRDPHRRYVPDGVYLPRERANQVGGALDCPGSERPVSGFRLQGDEFRPLHDRKWQNHLKPKWAVQHRQHPRGPLPAGLSGGVCREPIGSTDQFDGLIGDAVVRLSPSAESAYDGVPVQAADTVPADTGHLITLGSDPFTGQSTLIFDGVIGHYAVLTGQLSGDVEFDNTTVAPLYNNTFLVLLHP